MAIVPHVPPQPEPSSNVTAVGTAPTLVRNPQATWPPRVYPGATAQAARLRADLRADLAKTPGVPDDLTETITLCATEAFANAAEHTRSGEPAGRVVRALYAPKPRTLRLVVVDDGSPDTVPEVQYGGTAAERASAECGRGLLLVQSLADRWGTAPVVPYPFCAELGTAVWAEFTTQEDIR